MFLDLLLLNSATASDIPLTEWRWAILSIGVGAILLAIGLIALGIFLFRKRTTERTLLYFGIFVVVYAIRIFARQGALLPIFGVSPTVADAIDRIITDTISIPPLLIFLGVVQTRWRKIFFGGLGVQLAFAAVA